MKEKQKLYKAWGDGESWLESVRVGWSSNIINIVVSYLNMAHGVFSLASNFKYTRLLIYAPRD